MSEPSKDLHAKPWFGLLYLAFAYLPLLFWANRPASAVIATVVATVLFVPAHFAFYWADRKYQLPLTLFVACISFGAMPFSNGGTNFIIYAMAMAASRQPARRAVLLCVVFATVMAIELFFIVSTPLQAVASIAITAFLGTLIVSTILHSRSRAMRDAELRLTQDEVKRLATVAERERIGRDLHDLLGHTLSVVAIKSELARKLVSRDVAAAEVQIREVEQIARQALAEVREAVTGIRAVGLEAELAAARLALLSAEVHLDQRMAPLAIDEKVELAFALSLREAITNVLRHSSARRVEVELSADSSGARLTISDDGRGGIGAPGNGLSGMRERLRSVGGSLEIDSPRGEGTRLLARAPLKAVA